MALQKPLSATTGHTNEEAYHHLSLIIWDREASVLGTKIKIYKDKQAKDNGAEPFEVKSFDFAISEQQKEIGGIEDIYLMLKQLPEYEGALDV